MRCDPPYQRFLFAFNESRIFSHGRVQAMTENPYEIPAKIRELTEKSIEEARKAFESFIEAAQKATAQAEDTASALQSSAKEVSAKALSFTEAHVKAAFDHAQKLIHTKDPQEFLAHQSEYTTVRLSEPGSLDNPWRAIR